MLTARCIRLLSAKRSVIQASLPATRFLSVVPFKLADIGEGIAEVELLKWFVKEGDKVKSFDRICEVQSDKATVEITSRYDGVIAALHHSEGAIVKVGASLMDIQTAAGPAAEVSAPSSSSSSLDTAKAAPVSAPPAKSDAPLPSSVDDAGERLRAQATPAVRRIAKEHNLDLSKVKPTGPKGRVTKEDVLQFIKTGGSPSAAAAENSQAAAVSPAVCGASVGDRVVPIRGVQRLMVKSMTAALQVQHLTYCEEVVFDSMKLLRQDLKHQFSKRGVKISYMPLLIKATSLALAQFPILNATVNSDVTEMTYHENHNIGIAMDTPKGLVVPVIRQVQKKSIFEIAQELVSLQEAASNGSLTESQLSGGTFSLSNIGSVGGTYAVPVVVVPQVGIGAFGRLQVLPRYVNKYGKPASMEAIDDGEATVAPSMIMNVSWSADHRVVDGATVAKFSNLWKSYIEQPQTMLAELR